MSDGPQSTSYRDAGVDIDRGARLVERIKTIARTTRRDGVLAGIGGFGALFELPARRYREPLLVSGTDGVGTKLMLAERLRRHDTIGIDLVAMCVNDVLTLGAEPLFFLDYYATGRLDEDQAAEVLAGIGEGCRQAGAALIGGETAEMPGMYPRGAYDLAGFCVGVVEKAEVIDGTAACPGDRLLGIASSGPHSNGYSLIRKIIEETGADLDTPLDGASLGETLLRPTRIYVAAVRAVLERVRVHAIAHITGGGLTDNLPRVLPPGVRACVQATSWPRPAVFDWIARTGHVREAEMFRTFNCGIGMVLAVAPDDCDTAIEVLNARGEQARPIGHLEACAEGTPALAYV